MTKGVWTVAHNEWDTVLWFNVSICPLCARESVYPKMQHVAPGLWPSGGCPVGHVFRFLFWSVGAAVLRHRPPFQIGFECINEFMSHCWFPAGKLPSLLDFSSHRVYMHTRNLVTKGYLVTREITWPGRPEQLCMKTPDWSYNMARSHVDLCLNKGVKLCWCWIFFISLCHFIQYTSWRKKVKKKK